MMLLRDRGDDLGRAGIRPFAISRDSPWSHASWAMTLGVEGIPLLSDWNGEATRGFDVGMELFGMADVSIRSAFLIECGVPQQSTRHDRCGTPHSHVDHHGDTVRASWLLGREMPDVDAIIAAASSLSR